LLLEINRLTNMVGEVGTTVITSNSAGQLYTEEGPLLLAQARFRFPSPRRAVALSEGRVRLPLFPPPSPCHRFAGNPRGGPGRLKVEAPGDPVDIEQFTREVQAGANAALHRFEIHLAQRHAAAHDKFVLVQALARHRQIRGEELAGQRGLAGSRQGGPAGVGRNSRRLDQPLPEATRPVSRVRRGRL
jgi:hypothetical protein